MNLRIAATPTYTSVWDQLREAVYNRSAAVVKALEQRFVATPGLFLWYGRRFYSEMLGRELDMLQLRPGARVLHIGAGALPFTAYYLAERGYHVDAIDHDARTLAPARRLLQILGVADRVHVAQLDGLSVDAGGYDAVWISLHVSDKELILERLLEQVRPGGWVVYREPRDWLERYYHTTPYPAHWAERARRTGCTQPMGKQSFALYIGAQERPTA